MNAARPSRVPDRRRIALALGATAALLACGSAAAAGAAGDLADHVLRTLTLRDHNTRVVVLGTTLLGFAAGVVGTYMLLRRRSLVGDALSHATLPGICLAFIVMTRLGGSGKSLPGLLAGAAVFGLLGVAAILLIRSTTRIKEDAALGIVLSVAFGLGIALLGMIQKMPSGNQAGLESFIYGKTASMLERDAMLIGATALAVVLICTALHKEFAVLSFDAAYAGAQGWPVTFLDALMMLLVTGVTVVGLQAVGLILVIALLIAPAASARLWTDHLRAMLAVSGLIGAASGLLGALISATFERLPAGALIVLTAAGFFILSLVFGRRRGLLVRILRHERLRRLVARQHLLRAMFERLETHDGLADPANHPTPVAVLLAARSWSPRQLGAAVRRARRRGLVARARPPGAALHLTETGLREAVRVARNHRLWEMYLIRHADVAPSHVDRDADQIEHVLGPDMVRELTTLLEAERAPGDVLPSPHALVPGAGGGAGAHATR